MPDKILIVDDEAALRDPLATHLNSLGYTVEKAADGKTAIEIARQMLPNLVILDIMLPGMSGFEVCRILRQEMNVPIMMLTARDDIVDLVIGLEVGADDYLTKPFSVREFTARVKALLRRRRLDLTDAEMQSQTLQDTLPFDNLEIDVVKREVRLNGQPLSLKPKEYELLLFLARHRGQVVSRDHIFERVWGWGFSGGSRTVDVHIRWLREKIEPIPAQPARIVTVRGAGYRFDG